jgi:hypothetical protein
MGGRLVGTSRSSPLEEPAHPASIIGATKSGINFRKFILQIYLMERRFLRVTKKNAPEGALL